MDRFYPLGQPSADDVWKTTYEVANEMRSYQRSAYPPGTAVHLPGQRDRFGYSTPGPINSRLAKSNLQLTEDIDVPNPREHMSIIRIQEPDDNEIYSRFDVPEMMSSYNSPVAEASLSPDARSRLTLSRSRSVPSLGRKRAPPRLQDPNEVLSRIDNEHFSYFVPERMQRKGKAKLASTNLSKLSKENKISLTFAGEGTGFRSQGGSNGWWPGDGAKYSTDMPTDYRSSFKGYVDPRTRFYRASQAQVLPRPPSAGEQAFSRTRSASSIASVASAGSNPARVS